MKILENLNRLRNYTKNLNLLILNYGKLKTILEIAKEKEILKINLQNLQEQFILLTMRDRVLKIRLTT